VMDSACRMARIRLTSEELFLRPNHTPGGYMALVADPARRCVRPRT
jgi:hypothetical protein